MSERFERVFTLDAPLYSAGCPVIISAGALLKDSQTGNILAQIKFKSITYSIIKAITARITPLDVAGRPIDGPVLHDYLDLSAKRDDFFGQKEAVVMPTKARGFAVSIDECIMSDNAWNSSGKEFSLIPRQNTIKDSLKSEDLVDQYRIDICSKAEYEPVLFDDAWLCACGALNAKAEPFCHNCKTPLETINNLDIQKLSENNRIRLSEIERKKAEAAQQAAEKKKSIKRTLLIAVPVVLVIAAVIAIVAGIKPKASTNANSNVSSNIAGNIPAYTPPSDHGNSSDKENVSYTANKNDYIGAWQIIDINTGRYGDYLLDINADGSWIEYLPPAKANGQSDLDSGKWTISGNSITLKGTYESHKYSIHARPEKVTSLQNVKDINQLSPYAGNTKPLYVYDFGNGFSYWTRIDELPQYLVYYPSGSSTVNSTDADSDIIGEVIINVDELRIRMAPSTSATIIEMAKQYMAYPVYETTVNEGFQWYRIGENQWIADNGEWVTYENFAERQLYLNEPHVQKVFTGREKEVLEFVKANCEWYPEFVKRWPISSLTNGNGWDWEIFNEGNNKWSGYLYSFGETSAASMFDFEVRYSNGQYVFTREEYPQGPILDIIN